MAAMRPLATKRRPLILICICATILFVLYNVFMLAATCISSGSDESTSRASNSTLGFGAIYVLTEDTSTWRVQGLREAASLVGLKLTIPVQRHVSDPEVYNYLQGNEPITFLNEIRAVLSYTSLLETFIKSGHETALFVEDDVDFGIDIKSQTKLVSDAMLASYMGTERQIPSDQTEVESRKDITRYPYGRDMWDVFWVGHFGLEFTARTKTVRYHDPHALPGERLTSSFNNMFEVLKPQDEEESGQGDQLLLLSAAPMATYAFALTRANAQRLIRQMRENREQRFDLGLHIDCKGLKHWCVAPVPAFMHHHRVIGEKTIRTAGTANPGKDTLAWWRNQHKYTYNIEWSARCNAAGVGEKLGDRWQCMPGKYDKDV